jgi:hypothetical protein
MAGDLDDVFDFFERDAVKERREKLDIAFWR